MAYDGGMPADLDEILASHRTRRPILMGVLNVTPDSFSDGGEFFSPAQAIQRAQTLASEGADILDVGAESTRPGSQRVDAGEQIRRLQNVLPDICRLGVVVSIDTTLANVAAFALDCGAQIVNDVSAGTDDPGLLPLVAKRNAAVVLMHMLGKPKTMQENPRYDDVVTEVRDYLAARLAAAGKAGVDASRIVLDPGIGFGKRLEHNLALIAGADRLAELGRPVLVGLSRKRFLGELTGETSPQKRLPGTIAGCLAAWRRGATIFRVHDVAETAAAFAVAAAIESSFPAKNSFQ
jgi:dihydropteroate synthase